MKKRNFLQLTGLFAPVSASLCSTAGAKKEDVSEPDNRAKFTEMGGYQSFTLNMWRHWTPIPVPDLKIYKLNLIKNNSEACRIAIFYHDSGEIMIAKCNQYLQNQQEVAVFAKLKLLRPPVH